MHSRLIDFADHYWAEYLDKIERATAALDDDAVWRRPNEHSNSIANLLLHLCGNLRQWVLGGLLGESFERHRAEEFATRAGASRRALVAELSTVVARCRAGVRGLTDADLAPVRRIQTYEADGYSALFHAVEHMSYHTGQIVFLAKSQLPPDLAFEFYPQHRGE
jgi:uncharacterized damage-inducible protein DinB